MCVPNNEKDKIVNKLLLLYLINTVNEKNHFLGITKLHKLVYLFEKHLYTTGKRALNFSFFRWDYGPMSKEIYIERDFLAKNGLIEKEGNISITKRGKRLLSQCSVILNENKPILELINKVSNYSKYETEDLKNKIYNIKDPYWDIKISDLPKGLDLLVDLCDMEETIDINNSWIETLDILMDKDIHFSVVDAVKDAQVNKSIKFEGLLAI